MARSSNVVHFPMRSRPAAKIAQVSPGDGTTELRVYLKDIIDIAYEGLLTNTESQSVERIASLFQCQLK